MAASQQQVGSCQPTLLHGVCDLFCLTTSLSGRLRTVALHSCPGCWHQLAVSTCRFFETFSFLPPLDDDAIAKQVEYIIRNGWTPCLEFAEAADAYVKAVNTNHIRGTQFANYIDNR